MLFAEASLDLSWLTAILSKIDPQAAAIVAAVIFIIQHLVNKQGGNFSLAGLLNLLWSLFSKTPTAPVVPVPLPSPVPPSPVNDPLANFPVLKGLRDILNSVFSQKVTDKLAQSDDHTDALALFQKLSAAFDEGKVERSGPFVGPAVSPPSLK